MYDFERGDIVYVRDFPFGKPTRIYGKVVGILHGEYYNVLLTNGLNQDTIIAYQTMQRNNWTMKIMKRQMCS